MTIATVRITRAEQAASPYFYIPFEVPEGTTRIDVALAYAKADDCIIDLGAFDPRDSGYPSNSGFRGWSGGARDRFFIATDNATPGYVHGAIPPGTWNVILGLYKVPPGGTEVSVAIELDATPRELARQPEPAAAVRPGAGWYRGDLHCHTYHSDARGSPELLHAAAKQAGLDFLAVADHNTTTQRRYFHPHSSADLVFVRAMEVTTAAGHANVYGVDDWIDFRMTEPRHAHTLAGLVHERGGLLSINHDKPTIPWDYEFPQADCQEVWQSTWLAWNWISLERWQQRLAAGLHLSAIGGSDFHQPDRLVPEGPLALARPTSVLWLPELSEEEVLKAMKAGRGYVTESPTGPHIELSSGDAVMGGTAPSLASVDITVSGASGDQLVLVDATGQIGAMEIEGDVWNATAALDTPQKFVRAEVVAVASREQLIDDFVATLNGRELPWQLQGADLAERPIRRALTNPLYLET